MKKIKEPLADKLEKAEKKEGKMFKKMGDEHEALDSTKKSGKKIKKKK